MTVGIAALAAFAGFALAGMLILSRVFESHGHTCDAPGPVVPCDLPAGHPGRHAAHTGREIEEWEGVTA